MILDRPPPEWKRPDIPKRVKAAVLLDQGGKCRRTGVKLEKGNTQFNHIPELWERQFDTERWDTIPAANNPVFIEAVTIGAHDKITNGPGGEKRITTAGSGAGRRAKGKRLDGFQEDFRRSVIERPCGQKRIKSGKIRSRGFTGARRTP